MTPSTGDTNVRHDTLAVVTGRVGKGTARQTIRVDEVLWDSFGEATGADGGGRSGVLRDFMRWYTHEKGAKMPKRPDATRTDTAPEEA